MHTEHFLIFPFTGFAKYNFTIIHIYFYSTLSNSKLSLPESSLSLNSSKEGIYSSSSRFSYMQIQQCHECHDFHLYLSQGDINTSTLIYIAQWKAVQKFSNVKGRAAQSP